MKNRLKKIFLDNIGLKLLAVLFAIGLFYQNYLKENIMK